MKLLLDENIPAPITSTVKTLLRRSHDVQRVHSRGLGSDILDTPAWQQCLQF